MAPCAAVVSLQIVRASVGREPTPPCMRGFSCEPALALPVPMRLAALLLSLLACACFSKPERVDVAADASTTDPVDAGTDGASAVDAAPPGTCTQERCPGVCASDGFCEIQGSNSAVPQQCPAGLHCRILCEAGKCKGGVDCTGALTCDVHCIGKNTCKDGRIDCGDARVCTVECEGENACQGVSFPAVDCGDSLCQVECDGNGACQHGVRSTGGSCTAACCGDDATCQDSDTSCSRTAACD